MPSPSLALLSHAKQSLLYLKENSGQERAILTGIFSVEEMTTAQYKNLIGLHNEQGTYERVGPWFMPRSTRKNCCARSWKTPP